MALVRLYETTGEDKYLNLARFFIDERGTRPYYYDNEHPEEVKKKPDGLRYEYNQAHKPVREQDEVVGHSVRAVYLYSGMADVARLTEDESLLKACEVLWNNMTRKRYTGESGNPIDRRHFPLIMIYRMIPLMQKPVHPSVWSLWQEGCWR